MHWSEIDYASIVLFFQLAYGIGYAIAGRLMDLLGTRIGLGGAVLFWSLATAAHGLARGVIGLAIARAALGLGEVATSLPPSRRSVNGFRSATARRRRACSIPAAMSAR